MSKIGKQRFARSLAASIAFIITLLGYTSTLNAHPHVWIEVRNAITLDDQQRIVSIEIYWRFDEFYSAFAIQGLDTNNDGKYSSQELTTLLQDNLDEMEKTNYYTQTTVNGEVQFYNKAARPEASYEDGLLSMRFSLVLKTPIDIKSKTISIATFDPTYYIALDLAEQQPATFLGGKSDKCAISIKRPDQSEPVYLDDAIATTDASLARTYAEQSASQIVITCTL